MMKLNHDKNKYILQYIMKIIFYVLFWHGLPRLIVISKICRSVRCIIVFTWHIVWSTIFPILSPASNMLSLAKKSERCPSDNAQKCWFCWYVPWWTRRHFRTQKIWRRPNRPTFWSFCLLESVLFRFFIWLGNGSRPNHQEWSKCNRFVFIWDHQHCWGFQQILGRGCLFLVCFHWRSRCDWYLFFSWRLFFSLLI